MNGNFLYTSQVDNSLLKALRTAGIVAALVDLRSFRIRNYWRQPQLMIRDGWQLAPETNPGRESPHSWVLGDPATVGQRLTFDRATGRVRLVTYHRSRRQEVVLDLNTDQVLANRLT